MKEFATFKKPSTKREIERLKQTSLGVWSLEVGKGLAVGTDFPKPGDGKASLSTVLRLLPVELVTIPLARELLLSIFDLAT